MTSELDQENLKKAPLWYYIRKNKRAFSLGMFFLLITNGLDAYYPIILRDGIDLISKKAPFSEIQKTVIFFFRIMASLAVTRFFWRTFFGTYHTLAAEDLRNRVFKHLTKMGPSFFQKNPVGELMSLIVNDVQSFRQAIGSGVLVFVDGIIISCFVLPLMVSLSPEWTWKTLIFLPVVPFLIWKVMGLIHFNFKVQQNRLADLAGFSQEVVSGIRVIKTFAQEKNRLGMYNKLSHAFEQSGNRVAKIDALFMPVMHFGIASGTVILLFVAADDVLSGVATIGTFVAFQRYIQKMVWPLTAIGIGISHLQKGKASFDRIKDLLNQVTDIPDGGTIEIQSLQKIEVRNLSFQYPGATTLSLKNVSFDLSAGQTVGIVGPIGSGKSTLLHLLTRLYPTTTGAIMINGFSIEQLKQRSLRQHLVLVPQEAFLFNDSIADNVNFGLQHNLDSAQRVEHWAQVVDIHQEISDLPEKFASQLGERGVNLSGGQKQRLTLARALILESSCILLDDTLSAVDNKTEKAIEKQLYSLNPTQTKVIVTHRLSSVENADKIIVLSQGKVEATGSHLELLSSSPTYRQLAQIQGYVL